MLNYYPSVIIAMTAITATFSLLIKTKNQLIIIVVFRYY